MKKLVLLVVLAAGCTPVSLNSPRKPNRACSDRERACGCPGREGCSSCCSKDACRCREVAGR